MSRDQNFYYIQKFDPKLNETSSEEIYYACKEHVEYVCSIKLSSDECDYTVAEIEGEAISGDRFVYNDRVYSVIYSIDDLLLMNITRKLTAYEFEWIGSCYEE